VAFAVTGLLDIAIDMTLPIGDACARHSQPDAADDGGYLYRPPLLYPRHVFHIVVQNFIKHYSSILFVPSSDNPPLKSKSKSINRSNHGIRQGDLQLSVR
jgi:hypothetical protein